MENVWNPHKRGDQANSSTEKTNSNNKYSFQAELENLLARIYHGNRRVDLAYKSVESDTP